MANSKKKSTFPFSQRIMSFVTAFHFLLLSISILYSLSKTLVEGEQLEHHLRWEDRNEYFNVVSKFAMIGIRLTN